MLKNEKAQPKLFKSKPGSLGGKFNIYYSTSTYSIVTRKRLS